MPTVDPIIEESWMLFLYDSFNDASFTGLKEFLKKEKASGVTIYPPGKQIFNAFNLTPFYNVKVVIIGQDPYHGSGQAHGLCFSVPDNVKSPPSLVNIFKEIHSDLGVEVPETGNLEPWAKQGVLLLNAILTVQGGNPASHHDRGWENFTDNVIRQLSSKKEGLVFLLWGRYAQEKEAIIDTNKHHVLKATHPSPFSADKGFFGCKHFSKTNEILKENGADPINWDLN
ncbi:MAG: uracil-DNA glycosylase [Bacteroidetes bacterium]|nr:uracil-DNA glycosylase [Bacteroidota bacterium]